MKNLTKNKIHLDLARKIAFLFLLLCTTLSLTAQDWLWAKKTGSCTEESLAWRSIENVHEMVVDSVGNCYILATTGGYKELKIANENIAPPEALILDRIEKGISYVIYSLSPEGYLRWYKTFNGTFEFPYGDNFKNIYHNSSCLNIIDGELVFVLGSKDFSAADIKVFSQKGLDTVFTRLPDPLPPPNYGCDPFRSSITSHDIVLKLNLEGEIIWAKSLQNDVYPIPIEVDDGWNGDIYPISATFDANKNVHILYNIHRNDTNSSLPIGSEHGTYIVKFSSTGEFIETIPFQLKIPIEHFSDYSNFSRYRVNLLMIDGEYHLIYKRSRMSLPHIYEGEVIDSDTPPKDSVYNRAFIWMHLSDSLEFIDSKRLSLEPATSDQMNVDLFNDEFYISTGKKIIVMDTEGVVNFIDSIDNGFIYEHAVIDEENIAIHGRFGVENDTTFSQAIEEGNYVAIYHIPSQSLSYLSRRMEYTVQLSSRLSYSPTGHLYLTKGLGGTSICIGNLDTLASNGYHLDTDTFGHDVFTCALGWAPGEEGSWDDPQSPTTSVASFAAENELLLFPNPAQNQVTIKSENELMQRIELYNLAGQRVMELPTFASHTTVLNIAHLPTGLYVVKVYTQKGWVEKKLVVE